MAITIPGCILIPLSNSDLFSTNGGACGISQDKPCPPYLVMTVNPLPLADL